MIDFYTWKTPNGYKVSIMLEETGLAYKPHFVDISKQEQFKPAFLKLNPNNKIPVIVDHEKAGHPLVLTESGAIMLYLAEKSGKFLPKELHHRMHVMQWLMFQMASVGPMCGQLNYFLNACAEKIPYAIERYANEVKRIYKVMEGHLENKEFFVGDYSIADIAIFPWVRLHEKQRLDINDYPNLQGWLERIANRPAVEKGLALI